MADKKKFPSLPANYVSILQLQERWIKEKQLQKEIQQEEEEQRRREEEQRRREEEERLKEEQEDRKGKQGRERCEESNSNLNTLRPSRNRYHRSRRPKPDEAETRAESDVVAKIGTVVEAGEEVRDEERKTDDSKKKEKKNKWKKKGKSKKVEDVSGEMEPATEVVEMENNPVRRNRVRKGKGSEWRSRSEYPAASGKVWEAKDGLTVQIEEKLDKVEEKFGNLSVNTRKGEYRERERLRFERNGGGGGGRHMASGRFGGPCRGGGVRMPIGGSLVWVKKEEVSNGKTCNSHGASLGGITLD